MSDYSRGDYADLPAGTTDLENNYSAPDLTAIASNDNSTYAEQTANNEIAIHQYKKTVTGQYTNIIWSGKSSLAPSESPVIMEVYNVTGTPAWEELDRDDAMAADTDFDLSYDNLATADYLDSGVITWRVWQAASAGPVYIGENSICTISGCLDNWMDATTTWANNGGSTVLSSKANDTVRIYVPLIKFTGLASVTETPSAATLYLNINEYVGGTCVLYLYRVSRNWVAGTQINFFASSDSPPSSSWDCYADPNTWTSGGAQGAGDASATLSGQSGTIAATGWISITSSQLLTDVLDMIATPSTNYGWVINMALGQVDNPHVNIDSSNATTASVRPYLKLDF